jgi:hypothetical protein
MTITEPTGLDLTFMWEGVTLAGTLHCPPADGLRPAVLMMQGSGPADRDCGGYFPPIRDAFLRSQIATFAFDKPGCGESTGDWREYGLEDRVDQALAALEMLRTNPALDSGRVGIWGQSQGGWLVQMLASRLPDLPFAIANSGPSINVVEQDLHGCEHEMRSRGHPESEIEEALAFMTRLHEEARRGTDFATVEDEFLREARRQSWYGYADVEDAADWQFGCKLVDESYEPRDAMSRIRCPFLAIYGGRDVLVPAWRSAEETGRALEEAGNADATVVVFAAGDHRIRDGSSEAFVPGYLGLLGDWAARRAGVGHS